MQKLDQDKKWAGQSSFLHAKITNPLKLLPLMYFLNILLFVKCLTFPDPSFPVLDCLLKKKDNVNTR